MNEQDFRKQAERLKIHYVKELSGWSLKRWIGLSIAVILLLIGSGCMLWYVSRGMALSAELAAVSNESAGRLIVLLALNAFAGGIGITAGGIFLWIVLSSWRNDATVQVLIHALEHADKADEICE